MSTHTNNPTLPHAHRRKRLGGALTKQERTIAQDRFLTAFSHTANITASCQDAHIHRSTIYQWKEHDVEFSMRYQEAEQEATDMLFAAAWTRAVTGVDKKIVSMGKPVFNDDGSMMTEKEYSDTVLLRLMSYRVPGFSERRQIESRVDVQQNPELGFRKALEALPREQLSQIKQWLQEALDRQQS